MNDRIWKALADKTRREILDLLTTEPKSTGDLCLAFPDLDRCTVMKHLGVLEDVNLVVAVKRGRTRLNYLNSVPLQQIVERWLTKQMSQSAQVALRLKEASEKALSEQKLEEK